MRAIARAGCFEHFADRRTCEGVMASSCGLTSRCKQAKPSHACMVVPLAVSRPCPDG